LPIGFREPADFRFGGAAWVCAYEEAEKEERKGFLHHGRDYGRKPDAGKHRFVTPQLNS
jgi:hypothetical protein